MSSEIKIMEKPEWVSWEEIRQCLYDAHSVNRTKGINMLLYKKSPDEIRDYVGSNGVMLVALKDKNVVGACGIIEKNNNVWFSKDPYAQFCLGGILPEYSGRGIFKDFIQKLEVIAKKRGYSVILSNTHEKNKRRQDISKANGYHLVGYIRVIDHYNVLMAKWLVECPHSKLYCRFRLWLSWLKVHIRMCLYKLLNI